MADTKIIYIADDDDNIRQVIRTFLLSDGFAVEDFPTGDLLLARFREKPAELVILDVMMPGSDGFTIWPRQRRLYYEALLGHGASDAGAGHLPAHRL